MAVSYYCCSACVLAATFLGCLPNNFLAVNAGSKLGELKSFADLYDYKIVLAGEATCPENTLTCQVPAYVCAQLHHQRCGLPLEGGLSLYRHPLLSLL